MVEGALNHFAQLVLHVVAQIIEPELVVRAVGNIRSIRLPPVLIWHVGHNHARGQAQKSVQLPHFCRIAGGKIVINRDHMHTFARQRAQVHRQCCHQRFAFPRPHFRNAARVQDHATNQLHIKMPHTQHTARCLPRDGKCLG